MSDESLIKNVCAEMLHEHKESIRVIGCPTTVGCFKGREIENYIKGPLASKLNDLKTSQEMIEKEHTHLRHQQEEVIKMARDAAGLISESHKIIKEQKDTNEEFQTKQSTGFQNFRKEIWWELIKVVLVFIVLQAIVQLVSVKFSEEITKKSTDDNITTQNTNQERLESKLNTLIEGLSQVKVKGGN